MIHVCFRVRALARNGSKESLEKGDLTAISPPTMDEEKLAKYHETLKLLAPRGRVRKDRCARFREHSTRVAHPVPLHSLAHHSQVGGLGFGRMGIKKRDDDLPKNGKARP